MSEEQLSALLSKLKEDAGLREKLQAAGDVDSFFRLATESGFAVTKADLLKYQERLTLELSDDELESMSGGITPLTVGFGMLTIQLTTVTALTGTPQKVEGGDNDPNWSR